MQSLITDVKNCTICTEHLPLGPRPVIQVGIKSKVLIIGQAPGTKVHKSGIPWDDASGRLLRDWLGITTDTFYNPDKVALLPMGFCYPGKGKTGDLAPRPECAPQWHESLLNMMPNIELTILIGQYAQKYYLRDELKKNLTETVINYKQYIPKYLPLPHPSPRNRFWLKKNPWFETDVLPYLKETVAKIIPHETS